MKQLLVALVVIALFVSTGLSANTAPSTSSTSTAGDEISLARLQIPFIKNIGQAGVDVAFYADTFGGAVVVKKEGKLELVVPLKKKLGHAVIGETFVDSKIKAIEGIFPAVTRVSYFLGNDPEDWYSSIPTYEAVSLANVYDGIELALRAYGNNVEKLFYVSPGTDPTSIRVKVSGTRSVEVTEDGFLELETNDCIVHYSSPVAYQVIDGEKRTVDVAYRVTGDTYGFELGDYDTSKELVIDPLLQSTYFGGSGGDTILDLGIAPNGSIYAVGHTSSTDIIGFPGAVDGTDAFVANFNPSLTILQGVAYIGGTTASGGLDEATVVAFRPDSQSNDFDVYIAGVTASPDLAGVTSESADPDFGNAATGENEGFVSRLNSDLTLLHRSSFFGGATVASGASLPDDGINGIANAGDIFIVGSTSSSDIPGIDPASAQDTHGGGGRDGFIARLGFELTSTQAPVATYLGGSGDDEVIDLFIGATDAYVAGHTTSNGFPGVTAGASFQDTRIGGFDTFVTQISLTLTATPNSTYIGGASDDKLGAIADTGANTLYLTGTTDSADFPLGNPATAAFSGQQESFIAYIQKDLTTTSAYQATYLGGGGDQDIVWDLALLKEAADFNMATDSVYVTGSTNSSDFPGRIGGDDEELTGVNDVFVMRIDATLANDATYQMTYLGGSESNAELGYGIAVDSGNGVYVGGVTTADIFPGTTGGADADYNGSSDGFVARFDLSLVYESTAEIHVAPTILPIDFGEVFSGGTSDTEAIIINNFGVEDLVISDIVLSNTTDYTLLQTGTDAACGSLIVNYIVNATKQCLVWVTFNPQSGSADPFEATVTISSNDFDEAEKVVTLTGTGGSDSDGVPDREEQGPDGTDPDYDGNGDGKADRLQPSVASLYNHNNTFYVTLEATSGLLPADLENVSIAGIPTTIGLPDNLQAPYGYYSYSIIGLTDVNATARLILRPTALSSLSGDEEPDGYWKYGPQPADPTTSSWYEFVFDGATGAQVSLNQNTQFYEVTLNFIDGLRGDHDLTQNGRIDDPGAPVKVQTVTVAPVDNNDSSSVCFIATAAFGSYMHDDVKVLRQFRDDYLLTNSFGRSFVSAYYRYSPPVADYIAADNTRRTVARWLLTPLIYSIKHPYVSLLLMLAAGLMVLVYRQRVAMKQVG